LSDKKEIIKWYDPITRFYRETVGELRKVTWPTRQEAWNLTQIVLLVLVAMALFLGAIDLIGAELLNLALSVV
jgi:preprotein translocase subunit SecE